MPSVGILYWCETSSDDILNLSITLGENVILGPMWKVYWWHFSKSNQLKMSSSDSPISSATLAVTALYASPSSSESCNQIRLIASWNPREECEMLQKYLVEDHWGRSWSRFGGRAAKNVIKGGSGPAMSPLTSVKNLEKLLACCSVTTRHASRAGIKSTKKSFTW